MLVLGLAHIGLAQDPLSLGNPSKASANTTASTNFLIQKKGYVVSYHANHKIPNWVAWHLSSSWVGNAKRSNHFASDADVPSFWYRVKPSDYENSGFDKGHMCPSADRTASDIDNTETFLMTNMVPQSPNNNRQTWRLLEEYARKAVEQGNELYIIAGTFGKGGVGQKGYATAIDADSIQVPQFLWKILLILPEGEHDLERIQNETLLIAVWTPNTPEVSEHPWWYYSVSVDYIEQKTGYDFFDPVPDAIEEVLEKKVYVHD